MIADISLPCCEALRSAKVASIPRAQSGTTPFGSYRLEVDDAAPKVRVKTTITIAKTRILAAEYPAFRAFCEAADRVRWPRARAIVTKVHSGQKNRCIYAISLRRRIRGRRDTTPADRFPLTSRLEGS